MAEPAGPAAGDTAQDIEDLSGARLTAESRRELLHEQTECTVAFVSEDGSPAAVVLSYVVHEGRFWFTSVEGRAQVRGVERDPRACVVVSSAGTALAGRRMLSIQGITTIHRDPESMEPVLQVLARRLAPSGTGEFLRLLRSPGRVVIELEPTFVVASHDSRRLPGDGRGGPVVGG